MYFRPTHDDTASSRSILCELFVLAFCFMLYVCCFEEQSTLAVAAKRYGYATLRLRLTSSLDAHGTVQTLDSTAQHTHETEWMGTPKPAKTASWMHLAGKSLQDCKRHLFQIQQTKMTFLSMVCVSAYTITIYMHHIGKGPFTPATGRCVFF